SRSRLVPSTSVSRVFSCGLDAAWMMTSTERTASGRPAPVMMSACAHSTSPAAFDSPTRRLITRTIFPAFPSRGTSSRPSTPVPPVTSTRATLLLRRHCGGDFFHAFADVGILRRPAGRFLEAVVGDALRLQEVLRGATGDQLAQPLRNVARLAQPEGLGQRLRVLRLRHRLVLHH